MFNRGHYVHFLSCSIGYIVCSKEHTTFCIVLNAFFANKEHIVVAVVALLLFPTNI